MGCHAFYQALTQSPAYTHMQDNQTSRKAEGIHIVWTHQTPVHLLHKLRARTFSEEILKIFRETKPHSLSSLNRKPILTI